MKVIKPKNENGSWTKLQDIVQDYKVFLAGPCPRDNYEDDWRTQFSERCEELGCEGTLINPTNDKYDETNPDELKIQTEWEQMMMDACDVIFFNLDKSPEHPGFTTNFEIGYWIDKRKILVIYCPKGNKYGSNNYIRIKADKFGYRIYEDLDEAIRALKFYKNCGRYGRNNMR